MKKVTALIISLSLAASLTFSTAGAEGDQRQSLSKKEFADHVSPLPVAFSGNFTREDRANTLIAFGGSLDGRSDDPSGAVTVDVDYSPRLDLQ